MDPFSREVAASRPMLVRMARRRLSNEAWVEDAVSETVVAALENPRAWAGRASLRTWLVGILKNKVVDQVRRHTRECQVDAVDDGEPEYGELADTMPGLLAAQVDRNDPHHLLEGRRFIADVDRCLGTLPARQARAFMLRDWLDQDTDLVCSELGITANHLAVMLHRTRRRLRDALQSRWMPAATASTSQAHA